MPVPPDPLNWRVVPPPAADDVVIVRSVPEAGRLVALVFVMSRTEAALRTAESLLSLGVCASIFPSGASVATEEEAAVARLIAVPETFETGRSTMHHCDLLVGGEGLSATCPPARASEGRVRQQLLDGSSALNQAGLSPLPYWLPPFHPSDDRILELEADRGSPWIIVGDLDAYDWRAVEAGGPDTLQLIRRVVDGAQDGSVVMLHLGGHHAEEAISAMVEGLKARGLVPTTLSDLPTHAGG